MLMDEDVASLKITGMVAASLIMVVDAANDKKEKDGVENGR